MPQVLVRHVTLNRVWLSYANVQIHPLELHLISIIAALKNHNQLTDTCALQQSLTTHYSKVLRASTSGTLFVGACTSTQPRHNVDVPGMCELTAADETANSGLCVTGGVSLGGACTGAQTPDRLLEGGAQCPSGPCSCCADLQAGCA